MKETYVILVSDDGCEVQLTSTDNLKHNRLLYLDTEGNPMVLAKKFEANSWDDAKAVMEIWREDNRCV